VPVERDAVHGLLCAERARERRVEAVLHAFGRDAHQRDAILDEAPVELSCEELAEADLGERVRSVAVID